jgi:hypothetical protein
MKFLKTPIAIFTALALGVASLYAFPNRLTGGRLRQTQPTVAPEAVPLVGQSPSNDVVLIRTSQDGTLAAGEPQFVVLNTTALTRPADTTAYASGDLVANSTTAGSVTPLQFTVSTVAGSATEPVYGVVQRVRLRFNDETVTNAQFRVHFYTSSPTPVNGDNGAWKTNAHADYAGSVDVTVDKVFTSNAVGVSAAAAVPFKLTGGTVLYALLEARAAYTPTSGEVFNVTVEGIRK